MLLNKTTLSYAQLLLEMLHDDRSVTHDLATRKSSGPGYQTEGYRYSAELIRIRSQTLIQYRSSA